MMTLPSGGDITSAMLSFLYVFLFALSGGVKAAVTLIHSQVDDGCYKSQNFLSPIDMVYGGGLNVAWGSSYLT